MKKLKFMPLVVCMVMLAIALTGCKLFKNDYKDFKVQYTLGLQLLLGEEWHDDNIKGTATKSDGTEEDVTSKMTIDTSKYNKDQVGKYKIYFEFKDTELSYEVEVVEQITNSALISSRMSKVMQNSFVAKDGSLSFDAQMVTPFTYESGSFELVQTMYYREVDGLLHIYYMIETMYVDEPISTLEFWYAGDSETGLMTADYNNPEVDNDIDILSSLAEFKTEIQSIVSGVATELGQTFTHINMSDIFALPEISTYAGVLTMNQNLYTFENSDIIVTYKNGKVEDLGGITFAFDTTNAIPEAPVAEEPVA